MKKLLVIAVLFLFAGFLSAQDDSYKSEPGYVDFKEYADHDEADLMTEVMISEKLLKMASKMTKNEEKDVASVIEGLKLVSVKIFKVESHSQKYVDKIESLSGKLRGDDWERIVMTRERDEYVNVFIKTQGDLIVGLVVMAYDSPAEGTNDEGEMVYVNIVGDIDLEKIGSLSGKFDIPMLNHVDKRKHHDKDGE